MKTTTLAAWSLAAALALGGGCNQSDFDDVRGDSAAEDDGGPGDDDDGPGSDAREEEGDVGCEEEDECSPGETCVEGVCQMARCKDGPYVSAPPLSTGMRFFRDREILVNDTMPGPNGMYFVDGYAPEPGSIENPGSWEAGSTAVVDMAGGDFFGRNPELFVFATAGDTRIKVGAMDSPLEIDVGFQPFALAAGDTDQDQKDEVFVLGQFGNFSVCDIDEGTCSTGLFQFGNGIDVGIGDVDQDGQEEPVLLLDNSGQATLYVMEFGEETEDYQAPAGHSLGAIDVGDPDGDGIDEIYGLEEGGGQLYAFSAMGGAIGELSAQAVDNTSLDLAFADLDTDERDELLVLRENRVMELFQGSEGTYNLAAELTHVLQVSTAPTKIGASDFDGDSPRTNLMGADGVLFPGPVVPTTVALFPPFFAEFSDGVSGVSLGEANSVSEEFSDSVSLSASIDVGVSASLFGLFSGGVSTYIRTGVDFYQSNTERVAIGTRLSAKAEENFIGEPYGVVALNCGCFHAYYYEIEDPAAKLGPGGDKEQFVMMVPVGGTQMLWSTKRYNAMAEAVGNLPLIDIPYQIGNPSSYPTGPERLDGSPIPTEDFVFPEVPSILVSDVGTSSFRLTAAERETNGMSVNTSVDFSANLGVGPFKFGAGLGAGWGQGYSITVGESVFFSGSVPAIPDDPSTPEDEYLQHAYAFVPYVYREHYLDPEGNDAGYYVVSYAVAEQ